MASSIPSTPNYSTKSPTIRRILTEARELSSSPDPSLHASPLPTNIFEWHFTLAGPPSSPYSHGIYHGRIILPAQYPLRPPSFRFLTPSGRFEVNREICLSISGHHEESWQPAWGIRTALTAVRAFMAQGAGGQVGGVEMGEGERKRLAGESRRWRCAGCGGGGRTNEEVLREEGGWVGEGEGEDKGEGKKAAEASLPEGLKLGYRDELGAEKAETMPRPLKTVATPPTPASSLPSKPISLSSARTEKSDSKAPPSPPPTPTSSSSSSLSSQPTHATLTLTPTPSSTLTSPPPTTTIPAATAEPLPSWIDKAIVGITVILVLMLLRKILT